jgi:hypothetical protein
MDCRWRLPDFPKGPSPEGVPLWRPGTLPQDPVLLEPEQGLGDTLQFIRFIPELARRGHRMWLGCPKPLRRLLEGFPGVERLLSNTSEAAGAGCRLPLMSLPARLGITDLSAFSAPYLSVPTPPADSRVASKVAPGRKRIGFVWRGNPQHKNDHRRSIPLCTLSPLFSIPNVDWISLQVGGDVATEIAALRSILEVNQKIIIENAEPSLSTFLDTAFLINDTNDIITVDTAVAHLAGALGHSTNLIINSPYDWRWGQNKESTIWYKSFKIHRNTELKHINQTLIKMKNKLRRTLNNQPETHSP